MAAAHTTNELPGARALTRELSVREVPWGVVTSGTDAVAAARLAAVAFGPPPVLLTAEQVTAGKPNPEAYLTAAARLGVDPWRCLVVEDAPLVRGARRQRGGCHDGRGGDLAPTR